MVKKLRLTSRWTSGFGSAAAICLLLFSSQTYGQKTILTNSVDDSLSIKTITVAPMLDNVSQIYGKPLTGQLRNVVEKDRQWDLRSYPEGGKETPENFEDSPEAVKAATKRASTDALLSSRLTKGPNGISIKLNLFLAKDGKLFAQETLQDYSGFEIADLRTQLEVMYRNLKAKLPYSGVVLSRKGRQVTVNLGTDQGLREGNELSVVQIVKVLRHPRFNFVISAEKEIIGKIQIDKAEESLSFGTIVLERSENVLQAGMKVVPINFVAYPPSPKSADGKILTDLSQRPDSQVSLGDRPNEWVPAPPPSLGKVGMMLGLGSYAINNTSRTSTGSVSESQMPTPSIHLDGELWLTTHWFASLGLKQYILSIDNTYPGSNPSDIGISSTQTTLQGGYNFLLHDTFFGPKFQVLVGYSKFSATVDTTSPLAYTSMDFSGLAIGVAGSLPVSDEMPLTVGAKLMYYLNADVSESPLTSGSASAKITSFSAFGTYRWTEHMNLRGELMYDLFSASFSGTGTRGANSATSASHTLTTFAGGIEWMF